LIDNNNLNLYQVNRSNAVSLSYFVWNNIQDSLFDLIEELQSYDNQKSIGLYNEATELHRIIKKFENELNQQSYNINSVQHREGLFFPSITNELKNWIINMLEIFVTNSQIIRDDPNSIGSLLINFKNLNLRIRYRNDRNFIEASQRRKLGNWFKNNSRRIPLIYENSLILLQRTRDFSIHANTGINRQVFTAVRRNLSDPLIGIPSPGSIIVLCGQINSIIYCFIELIQTWLETCKVRANGGLRGSTRFT
jgi:hypothetical protein